MDKAIEQEIQKELQEFHLPRFRDIPDVGLLLEQTMRLVCSYLEPLGDIKLTSSMISNYVKQGIIARPVKKMYGREQIADLVFIAVAKTVLPLDDIKQILDIKRQDHRPEEIYDYFCDEYERIIGEICNLSDVSIAQEAGEPALHEMLRLIIVASAHMIYLEKHIRAMLPEEPQKKK